MTKEPIFLKRKVSKAAVIKVCYYCALHCVFLSKYKLQEHWTKRRC